MPAGLEIINDSGTVLLDENYFVLNLIQKGTLTTVARNQGTVVTGTSAYTFQTAYATPFLALTLPNCWAAVSNITLSNNIWTYQLGFSCPVGTVINWYIFGPGGHTAGASNSARFEVYMADGSLGYSLNSQPMRIVASIPGGTTGQPRTFPTGRTYALVMNNPTNTFQTTLSGDNGAGTPTFKRSRLGTTNYFQNNNQVNVYVAIYSDINGPYRDGDKDQTLNYTGGPTQVVDVTNY